MRHLPSVAILLLLPLFLLSACAAPTETGEETPPDLLSDLELSSLPQLSELTETNLTTAERFDSVLYPLLAALAEQDIWLYAAEQTFGPNYVILRQGDYLQDFCWDWRNADFVLPRLQYDDDLHAYGTGIFCVLQVSDGNQPLLEELHYLYETEEGAGWQELILRPQAVQEAAYGRNQQQPESTDAVLRLASLVDDGRNDDRLIFDLAWPEGYGPEDLTDVSVCSVSYGLGQEEAPYYSHLAAVGLSLNLDGSDLPLAHLYYNLSGYNPAPYVEHDLRLDRLEFVRLAGDGSIAIPESVHPQAAHLPQVEEDLLYGLTLRLPGNWRDNYVIQRAADIEVPEDEAHWYEYLLCRVSERQCFELMGGGMLFKLEAYPLAGFEERYADAIAHGFAGNSRFLGQDGSYGYILTQSSDVQAASDLTAAWRYYALRQENEKIIEQFVLENNLQPFSFQS